MSITVDLRADTEAVRALLKDLPKGVPIIMQRSLTRTIKSVRTVAARNIAAQTGLRVRAVSRALRITTATRKNLVAVVHAEPLDLPVIEFRPRQGPVGTSYSTGKGKPRVMIPSAFIQTMHSGHTGVFKRYGGKRRMRHGTYKGQFRQPIFEEFVDVVTPAFVSAQVVAAMRQVVGVRMPIEITQQLRFFLQQRESGFGDGRLTPSASGRG